MTGEKVDIKKLTEKTINDGGILALLYFDVHGNNKDAMVQMATAFIGKIVKEKGVVYALGEIDEPMENDGMLSTSIELKVLTVDFLTLTKLCADYSPFSLEILKPNDIHLPIDMIHELLLSISTTTLNYKKYILDKVASEEEKQNYALQIKNKVELGKKLLEKKGD
ncbi:hypothetical protein KAW38_00530 [Candidatus Micrarchaeota archaeon]|nr:hypothetical protein [Candidatus Micrarchaeota archaeon]